MILVRIRHSIDRIHHALRVYALIRRSALALAVFYFCGMSIGSTQQMTGVYTKFNNTFREWTITTDDEELRGELRLRWIHSNDWTAWDFSLGDIFATIEQKWTEDPNLWVIRCNGILVNAKTAWAGEFMRWKLHDGNHQFNWESKYGNQRDEWELETRKNETYTMHTYWEGNPMEWVIEDRLPDDVSMAMKVAMVFLTLHFSTPRI